MTAGVRSAADILRDVLADPDAPPITNEDWRAWVPDNRRPVALPSGQCGSCGEIKRLRAAGMCGPCYWRDKYCRPVVSS